MSMPWTGTSTSFAEAASLRPVALEVGVPMVYRGLGASAGGSPCVVLADSGMPGLDGRHWVHVKVSGNWEVHVLREDLH